jgi:hypothetical protein
VVDNSVQVQISGGPESAHASIWSKVSQDTDMSQMKQPRGHIQDTKTPPVETEAKNHEVQEISVVDERGIFQVTKMYHTLCTERQKEEGRWRLDYSQQ